MNIVVKDIHCDEITAVRELRTICCYNISLLVNGVRKIKSGTSLSFPWHNQWKDPNLSVLATEAEHATAYIQHLATKGIVAELDDDTKIETDELAVQILDTTIQLPIIPYEQAAQFETDPPRSKEWLLHELRGCSLTVENNWQVWLTYGDNMCGLVNTAGWRLSQESEHTFCNIRVDNGAWEILCAIADTAAVLLK